MNKIYKVVWSRAKGCYVVVSEYAKRTGKSAQTKKLLAALMAAGIMTAGVGIDAGAAQPEGDGTSATQYVAIKTSNAPSNDYTYDSDHQYWVRNGYKIVSVTNQAYTPLTNEKYDQRVDLVRTSNTVPEGVLEQFTSISYVNGTTTNITESLNHVEAGKFAGVVNTGSTSVGADWDYIIQDTGWTGRTSKDGYTNLKGSSNPEGFKTVGNGLTWSDDLQAYVYTKDNVQYTVSASNLYVINGNLGTFTKSDGSLYTGTVFGANNEILKTAAVADSDGKPTYYSYWAAKVTDPNLTMATYLADDYVKDLGVLEENDKTLYHNDIKEVKGENTDANTGSIQLVRNGTDTNGTAVDGTVTIKNTDGTITVSVGDDEVIRFGTGSAVAPIKVESTGTGDTDYALQHQNEITGVAIDGSDYTTAVYHNKLGALVSNDSTNAYSAGSIALGQNTAVAQNSDNAIAIGTSAGSSSAGAIAIGNTAGAADLYAVAIGDHAEGTSSSVAIGGTNTTANNHSIAIGVYDSTLSEEVAQSTLADGKYGIAVGLNTRAKTENAVALGTNASVNSTNGVAIGVGATNNAGNAVGSVALGAYSVVDTDRSVGTFTKNDDGTVKENYNSYYNGYVPSQGYDQADIYKMNLKEDGTEATDYKATVKYDENSPVWRATDGAISVGVAQDDGTHSKTVNEEGHERTRQITHVAAGKDLTDAVNVAQLNNLKEYVDSSNHSAGKTDYSLIGSGEDGKGEYTVSDDGKVSLTVKDGSKLNQGSYQVTISGIASQSAIDELNDFAVKYDTTTDANGKTVANKTSITLNPDAPYTVTKNEDGTTTVTGGSTITNLRPGALSETSTDAVNGSQLYATNQNVTTNTTNITTLQGQVISGGSISDEGQITLTTAGKQDITLTGQIHDYNISQTGSSFSNNTLTIASVDKYGNATGDSVVIEGIAGTSDVAKAKTEVQAGTNVTVTTDTTSEDGHTIYTVNAKDTTLDSATKSGKTVTIKDTSGKEVSFEDSDTTYSGSDSITINNDNSVHINEGGVNIAYTANGNTNKKSVSLADGFDFIGSGATTVTAGDNGQITISSTDTNNYVKSGSVTTEGEGDSKKTYINLKREGLDDVKIDVSGLDTGSGSSSDYRLVKNTNGTAYTVDSNGDVKLTVQDGDDTSKQDTVTISGVASKSSVDEVANSTVTGGDINNDGSISLTKKDNTKVTLTGQIHDYNISQTGSSFSNNTLTIASVDKYGNATGDSVVLEGIAGTSDVAMAKTEVKAGTNVTVTTDTTSADGHTIYTVNAKDTTLDSATKSGKTVTIKDTSGKEVSFEDSDTTYSGSDSITINNDNSVHINEGGVNIAYTANGNTNKKSVSLADGFDFIGSGATTVTAGDNGQITISSTDTNDYVTSGTYDSTNKKLNFVNTDTSKNFSVDLSGITSGLSTSDWSLVKGTAHISGTEGGDDEVTGYKVENGQIKLQVKDRNDASAAAEEVIIDDVASKTALDALDDLAVKYDSKDKTAVTLGGTTYNTTDKTGGTKITNVAYATGTDGSEAVNVDYLKQYVTDNGGGSWNLTTTKGTATTEAVAVGKGDTVNFKGANGVEVTNEGKNVTVGLGKDITIGKAGKDGVDGAAGSIGIAGKDGTKGEDGKDGISITTIRTEYISGKDGIPGLAGKDGVDGITRIIYQDKDGEDHKVATLDDGLNFAGDDANVKIGKKLNETLQIKGGADSTKLTDNNIGVVVNDDGTMSVKLSSDITGITKLETVNNYTVENDNSVTNKKYVDNLFKTADGNHTAVTVNGGTEASADTYTSGNLQLKKTTTNGKDTYDVKLADDLTLGNNSSDDYVTINGSAGTIKASHSIAAGNVIMSGDNGTIIGLTNKTTKYDEFANGSGKAATEEQLKEAMAQAKTDAAEANTDTHIKAGEYSIDKEGNVSMDVVDKNGNATGDKVTIKDVAKASDIGNIANFKETVKNKDGSKTTVVDAINNVDSRVTTIDNRVTKIEETAGKHSSVSAGDTNLVVDDTSTNDAGGTDYKISLAKDLKVDSVTAGEKTTINGDGVSYDGKNYIGKDGINANSQKITNVADGKVEKDSKDAVNGGQLFETNQNVTNNTIAINNISGSVNKLGNRINRVGAGAAALASLHPLDFDPDAKWDFAAGYGNYRGANAAAVGAYYRPNEDLMFSVGGSFGGGENMVNAGVSVKLGSGSSHVNTSKVAMAKEIQALREHVAQQDKLIAKMAQGEAISQKDLASTMQSLFPDVPENHWAYDYVQKLGEAGLVEGYPDGEYKGDRMLTRYEFAAVIYRAMQLGVSRMPELSEDGTLSKLVNEFAPELQYIRVDTVKADKEGNPEIQRVRTVKENLHK